MVPYVALVIVVVFIGLFIYALVTGSKKQEETRRNFFREFAEKRSMRFSETDSFNLKEKIHDLGAIGYARNEIKNIAFAKEGNDEVYLFDQVKVTTTGGSRGGYFTVCLIVARNSFGVECVLHEVEGKLAARLSRSMGGARSGMEAVELGDPEFDNRYVVFSNNAEAVRKPLGHSVRQHLLRHVKQLPMPLVIQIKDNRLAVHNSGQSPRTIGTFDQLQTLLDVAKGLKDMLKS